MSFFNARPGDLFFPAFTRWRLSKKKRQCRSSALFHICALAGIQTPNLLIRSQVLYSVELQARPLKKERKYSALARFANRVFQGF
jgi:hypothetical protein